MGGSCQKSSDLRAPKYKSSQSKDDSGLEICQTVKPADMRLRRKESIQSSSNFETTSESQEFDKGKAYWLNILASG